MDLEGTHDRGPDAPSRSARARAGCPEERSPPVGAEPDDDERELLAWLERLARWGHEPWIG